MYCLSEMLYTPRTILYIFTLKKKKTILITSEGVFIPACLLPDKEARPELDAHCLITWDILMARQKMVKYD